MRQNRRVLVVTPSFQSEAFIDETVHSVLTQVTDVPVHYHVQDGGSSDGTLDKLRRWSAIVENGELPGLGKNTLFSFASATDSGMYDAINTAFARLNPQSDDILTWINSDDRLAPGALITVEQVFVDVPSCHFLSARISIMNEGGSILGVGPATGYAQACLAAGLHDGRWLEFVMQEGTFFSGEIWNDAGGVDPRYKLAGDWDLWRRLAAKTPHFTLDSITGFHRRRHGQLSGDMDRYYREVDQALIGSEAKRDAIFNTAMALSSAPPAEFLSNLIRFDTTLQRWVAIPFNAHATFAPRLTTPAGEAAAFPLIPVEGFFPREGPYPEYGLYGRVCWMRTQVAASKVDVPENARYVLRLLLRAGADRLTVSIAVNGNSIFRSLIPDPVPMHNEAFEIPVSLRAGSNIVVLTVTGDAPAERPLLLIDAYAIQQARRSSSTPGWFAPTPPTIMRSSYIGGVVAVVDGSDRPDLLSDTVASIREQDAVLVSIVVCVSTAEGRLIAESLGDQIDLILSGMSVGHTDLETRLASIGARIVFEIAAGNMLARGALDAALAIFIDADVQEVGGIVELCDRSGLLLGKRLPHSNDKPLFRRQPNDPTSPSTVRCNLGRTLLVDTTHDGFSSRSTATPLDALIIEPWSVGLAEGTSLQSLAKTLAILGGTVRYVHGDRMTRDAKNGLVRITGYGASDTVSSDGETLEWSFTPDNDDVLTLPTDTDPPGRFAYAIGGYVDTVTLAPRTRWLARQCFKLPSTGFILALSPAFSDDMLAGLYAVLATSITRPVVIVRLTYALPPAEPNGDVIWLEMPDDDFVLSYTLSSIDVLITMPGEKRLCLKAAACALPVLEFPALSGETPMETPTKEAYASSLAGLITDPVLTRMVGTSARAKIEADHSLDAAALGLRNAAGAFPPAIAEWLSTRATLSAGARLRVSRSAPSGLPLSPLSEIVRLVAGPGAKPRTLVPPIADASVEVGIEGKTGSLFVVLTRCSGEVLRFQLSGPPTARGNIYLDDGPPVPFDLGLGGVTINLAKGRLLTAGLYRIDIVREVDTDGMIVLSHPSLLTSALAIIEGQTSTVPLVETGGAQRSPLTLDGDWQFGENYYSEESSYPALGIYTPVRWSKGPRSTLYVLARETRRYRLCLAVTGIVPGQRCRIGVAGAFGPWSEPFDGIIGRVHHPVWDVELAVGQNALDLELSASSDRPDGRSLGLIVLGVSFNVIETKRRSEPIQ